MPDEKHYETLLVRSDGGVAIVTLNRPEVLNAFNPTMGTEIPAALRELADDDGCRVVILTGAGRAFCSGADISKPKDGTEDWNANVVSRYEETVVGMSRLMVNYPKPTISAINGVAIGVGFTLTLPCDIRLASENAVFRANFTRIGLIPELGSTFLLPRIVGFGKAMELVLTGRTIDAHEAKELGLVNQVTAEGKVVETAMEMARMILKSPPGALRLTKQALHYAAGGGMLQATTFEGLALQACRDSADHKEAIKAFREKREPRFTGR